MLGACGTSAACAHQSWRVTRHQRRTRRARWSAPFLAHEPFQDRDALLPVFDAVLPHPDLGAGGGRLPAPREGAAQGIAINVPRALPQPRERDSVQCAVRTEML